MFENDSKISNKEVELTHHYCLVQTLSKEEIEKYEL